MPPVCCVPRTDNFQDLGFVDAGRPDELSRAAATVLQQAAAGVFAKHIRERKVTLTLQLMGAVQVAEVGCCTCPAIS